MNAIGKSHNRPNNTIRPRAFCLFTVLNRDSRITKGTTRIKLMIPADLRSVVMVFTVSPCLMSSACSLIIPMAVSVNIHSTKRDVVGFHPQSSTLVHYEPSIDALSWEEREARYKKKFQLAQKYMFTELFAWLPPSTHIEQIAIFYNHPRGRDTIAGAKIMSIDELMAEIRSKIIACGPMIRNAISAQYPLLRTIQMSHAGYCRPITAKPADSK